MMFRKLHWPGLTAMLAVFFALATTLGLAQATNTGTVVGEVTDQSGAVVPGALVTLTESTTNVSRTTTTGKGGQYSLINVPPGTYSITATKTGFNTDKTDGLIVEVSTQTTANFKLTVGSSSTTVEVQATSTDLQTINSTLGSTVDSEAIAALPSLLHDVSTFTELQAGVSPDGSVAGAVNDQNTFTLDGGNNSSDMDGSTSVYTPSFAGDPTGVAGQNGNLAAGPTGVMPTPADSVEEFKVNTTNQTADFNNSSGAQVAIVTKRGTNSVHGSAYEYYLDNNFSGNSWGNNLSGTPVPDYHYSKFGGSAGFPIAPKLAGGKTYLFVMYQGWRFPNAETFSRPVPSNNLKNGILSIGGTPVNLKSIDPRGIGINPVVQAMWNQYEPAEGSANVGPCTDLTGTECDSANELEFKANVAIPENDNFMVARIDHDFGENWHFMSSFRYYRLERTTTSQVDIGGFFTGDKLGVPAAVSSRPQQPWFYVAGLTTNFNSRVTNDFHYSFLRNFWSWSDDGAPPQASGLGGALEPFGETGNALSPFNLNSQSIRTRFWDGQDHFLSDNVTWVKGNHLITFGGQYQHNFNYHQRTDNGGGINYTTTYQLGNASTGAGQVDFTSLAGSGITGSEYTRVAAAALGIVTAAQVAYTRSGNALSLNPPLTPASDKVTIPYYNVYFGDTWHMKPSLTLSYGLGWALEMPPTEASGKQIDMVDQSDTPVKVEDYLARRKAAAQAGGVYNPEIGFALVGNVGAGQKYPYNPFYGSFSPRVGAAWNPHFANDTFFGKLMGSDATVIRGGYGRIYGRLNGVDLVLVPLLGLGLIQPVQCTQAFMNGTCGGGNPTVANAFRIGVDGDTAPLAAASATLPQPVFPGYNSSAGSASEALDPGFRPNDIDSFDLTIQRQLTRKALIEVGYIGRLIHHEYQPVNLNAVPYMLSGGTQNFAQGYASLEKQLGCVNSAAQCGANVPAATTSTGAVNPAYTSYINSTAPQSFFENQLKGSKYCGGTVQGVKGGTPYANCTAAVLDNELGNLEQQAVWNTFSDIDTSLLVSRDHQNTMLNSPTPNAAFGANGSYSSGAALNASIGHGNYNGGFITFILSSWHGLTMHHNFTYSKALGTGAFVQATSEYTPNDPFNLDAMYGVQAFNRKFVYNTYMVWTDPFYKSQHGLLGRALGGWSLAPIFTAGNGEPLGCGTWTGGQSFGGADANNYYDNEQCVFTSKYNAGVHSHFGVTGGTDPLNPGIAGGVGTATAGSTVGTEVNMFKDPVSVFNQVRAPILGIDTKNPGVGPIIGMPYWNVDMSLQKNIKIWEKTEIQASMIFANVFNHNVLADPGLSIGNPNGWGDQYGQANVPRTMEFGLRASF